MSAPRRFFKKARPGEESSSHVYRNIPKAATFEIQNFTGASSEPGQPVPLSSTQEELGMLGHETDHFAESHPFSPTCSASEPKPSPVSQSLFPGSPYTSAEALQDLLEVLRKHNASKSFQADILWYLDKYLPANHSLPRSFHLLEKRLEDFRLPPVPEYYCSVHVEHLGRDEGKHCLDCADETSNRKFHSFDVKGAMSQLLSDPVVSRLMKRPIPPGYLDIKHGRRYRELPAQSLERATLLFWYDGTNLKGRKMHLWILAWMLVELPIECRWDMARYAVVLCAQSKTKAHVLLAPFVRDLELAMHAGVLSVQHDASEETNYSFNTLCCCCDAPARCDGRGTRQWNAKEFGCTTCLACGSWTGKAVTYPYVHGARSAGRTHEQTHADAKEWALNQVRAGAANETPPQVGSRGTNGFCELLKLPKQRFDVIRSFPHEIMHLFLNLGSQLISVLRETDLHTMPYALLNREYAAGRTRFIDNFEAHLIEDAMKEITFPSPYHRIPRPDPKEWRDYKSSEHMCFILVIIPLIFQKRGDSVDKIVPEEVRKLLLTLSYAMHYLMCDRYNPGMDPASVLQERAETAQRLVDDFVHQSTRCFGAANITYAFHQLQHLPQNYLDFGPAYAWSAFGWESLIGVAKRMQHGTNKAQQELTNKIVHNQAVRTLLSKDRAMDETRGLGVPLPVSSLSVAEKDALDAMLARHGLDESDSLEVFKRIAFRKYYRAETVKAKRTSGHSDCTFKITTGEIVAFTSFVCASKNQQNYLLAIGNVLTGCNVRTHLPIIWKEAGLSDARPVRLEVPKLYREIVSQDQMSKVVFVQNIDFPVFVLLKPANCLGQFLLPSLTVMPKD